ncbi:MAG: N-acetylmuramoyl-L-alanine amidase [Candidatus Azobacteroides sp.]|nr:N-acetylmuramoyl-L-alanine amidase [Candidatus Azobacteroides sp.]
MIKFDYILCVILLNIFVFPASAGAFVLVIDPGHGGKDTGALGKKGKEKNINLAVSLLVGQYIASEHPDVKIIYTRTKDVFIGLDDRADIANKANANLFISIHTNSVEKKSHIRGAEVYTFGVTRIAENLEVAKRENSVILLEDNYEQKYLGFDPNSAESYIMFEFMVNLYAEQSINFASMVQRELVNTAKRENRGVKQAGYLVLRKSAMPRILIELDFISNSETENYLLSSAGQKSLARAISNAFTEYKKEFDRVEKGSTKENTDRLQQETLSDKMQPPVQEDSSEQASPAEQPAASEKIYKIQILASVKKLPDKSPELKGYPADYYVEGKYYKYMYGESADWNEIDNLRKKISKDFKGAFIVAFENGVKVSVNN